MHSCKYCKQYFMYKPVYDSDGYAICCKCDAKAKKLTKQLNGAIMSISRKLKNIGVNE